MNKKNILLIDNEPLILDLFEYGLSSDDRNIIKAENSYKAVQTLLRKKIDLIVCETDLENGYGFSLAAIALSIRPRTSIIMTDTSYSDVNYNRANILGYDYLPKPIPLKELIHSANVMLGDGLEYDYRLAS